MSDAILAVKALTAPGRAPERWMLVLHGVFGQGRNWNTVMRGVVAGRPAWGALLVDLRGHGDSPPMAPPHTMAACAADLVALQAAIGRTAEIVVGHSLGGKVALALGGIARPPLRQIWMVESMPDARPPSGAAWALLALLRRLPAAFPARQAAIEALMAEGCTQRLAAWMATNLTHEDGQYVWRIDFSIMEALLADFFAQDLWAVIEYPPEGTVIHAIKAEDSSTLTEEAAARLVRAGASHGRAFLHRLAGGHWINTDDPEGVRALLTAQLP